MARADLTAKTKNNIQNGYRKNTSSCHCTLKHPADFLFNTIAMRGVLCIEYDIGSLGQAGKVFDRRACEKVARGIQVIPFSFMVEIPKELCICEHPCWIHECSPVGRLWLMPD